MAEGVEDITDRIVSRLRSLGIEFRVMEHEAVRTSADAARARGVDPSTGAKALLVRSDDGELSLFVVPGDRKLDWKRARAVLRARSVRMATEDELFDRTGLTKGSVPPLGNLLGIRTFVDVAVLEQPLVRFNAGSLVRSIEMPGKDLERAAEATPGSYAAP